MHKFVLAGLLLASGAVLAAPTDVNVSYMDKSVAPGNDFFLYGNGGWSKHAVIPPDRAYAGVNLELNKQNDARLKAIADDLLKKPDASLSAEERKLRDLYADYMDVRTINAAGMNPAASDLARIAAAKDLTDIAQLMGDPALNLDGPYGFGIEPDEKHPTQYAVHLGQSGLGMPDRDYYLKDDKALATDRAAYKVWLEKALGFAGVADAKARAAAVFELEMKLAQVSWAAAERRDQDKVYNPTTVAGLEKSAPEFPWETFLAASHISPNGPRGARVMIVGEVTAFPKLAKVFVSTPVAVWRDYLITRYIHAYVAQRSGRGKFCLFRNSDEWQYQTARSRRARRANAGRRDG